MLIKSKDDIAPAVTALEKLLALKNLTSKQRERIEEELGFVRAGAKGEKEAAYHIDFKLKDSKNWAVIHDLRLEHNGRVAQIDHLLIGRMFDLFVIESKNVKTAVRINDGGEFEVMTRYGWKGMASPIEQNKRHIRVLDEVITDNKLAPSRLGFQIRPTFRNWVLIASECNLTKNKAEEATILKMDMFDRGMEEHFNNAPLSEMMSLAKICSVETIAEFAQKLIGFHRPASFDYAAKFGISIHPEAETTSPLVEAKETPNAAQETKCDGCGASVEAKVVNFCRLNKRRFEGKILCRTCQTSPAPAAVSSETPTAVSTATCNECDAPVDSKVVAFCRFNSKRFGKRILCRTCQTRAAVPVSAS